MYKIKCWAAIFQSIFLNPLMFCFPAIVVSLAQINWHKFSTGLNVSSFGTWVGVGRKTGKVHLVSSHCRKLEPDPTREPLGPREDTCLQVTGSPPEGQLCTTSLYTSCTISLCLRAAGGWGSMPHSSRMPRGRPRVGSGSKRKLEAKKCRCSQLESLRQ